MPARIGAATASCRSACLRHPREGNRRHVFAYPLGYQFTTFCEKFKVIGGIFSVILIFVTSPHSDFGASAKRAKFFKNQVWEQTENIKRQNTYNDKFYKTVTLHFQILDFYI